MNTKTKSTKSIVICPNAVWRSDSQAPLSPPATGTLESLLTQTSSMMSHTRITRTGYNACYHEKGELLSIATKTSSNFIDSANEWLTVDCGSQFWHLSENPSIRVARQFAGPSTVDANGPTVAFYLRRCVKMPPRFVSILNFIVELRSLSGLWRFWRQKVNFLVNIANTHLAWVYGWKLFLRDICSVLEAMKKCVKLTKEFLKTSGLPKKGRYRVPIPQLTADKGFELNVSLSSQERWLELHNSTFPPFVGKYDHFWRRIGETYEVANVRYSLYCPKLSFAQAKMRSYLHAFGVEWDPRILWDAIPWSFLIDWFLSVGDWIDSWGWRNASLPLYARIHDMSITRRLSVESEVMFQWVKDLSGNIDTHIVRCKGTCYSRKTEIQVVPTKDDLISSGFSQLEVQQLLNGLALITVNTAGPDQRAPRVKKDKNKWPQFPDGENLPKNRKPKTPLQKAASELAQFLKVSYLGGKTRKEQRIARGLARAKSEDAQGKRWRKAGRNPIAPPPPGPKLPRGAIQVNRGYLPRLF